MLLSDRIGASRRLDAAADLVILAVPAQASRAALAEIGAAALAGMPVVLTAKGLEAGTLKRQSEILVEIVPAAIPYRALRPELCRRCRRRAADGRDPGRRRCRARRSAVAAALAGPTFRPYAAGDRVGVELAGALKNVYALACGAVEGAGPGRLGALGADRPRPMPN